jgi:hypothetical protein
MNKRKQIMIYRLLLPMNVVDIILDVAGLSSALLLKDGCARWLSKKRERERLAAFFTFFPVAQERWLCVLFSRQPRCVVSFFFLRCCAAQLLFL